MIQRIQTLFLLVIFGLMLSMFFTNLADIRYEAGDNTRIEADGTIVTTKSMMDEHVSVSMISLKLGENSRILWASLIVLILATGLPLFNIFTFHNRKFQLKMCFVEGVLLLGLIGFETVYLKNFIEVGETPDIKSTLEYGISAVFPLIALILTFMAGKRIIKDEAMVTACDRLR